jgi:hypothetical protein
MESPPGRAEGHGVGNPYLVKLWCLNCNLLLMHNKCTLLKQTEGNYTGLRTGHERRKIKSDLVEDRRTDGLSGMWERGGECYEL